MIPFGHSNSLVPTPLAELDGDFVQEFGKPAGLWLPSDGPEAKAIDFSGNGNFGSLNGGVAPVPANAGIFSTGWKFPGTNGSGITINVPVKDWSWMALIQPTSFSLGSNYANLCATTGSGGLWLHNGKLDYFKTGDHFANTTLTADVPVVLGMSHNDSGTSTKFYFNGQPDGTASFAADGTKTLTGIGADGGSGIEPFGGIMAVVIIWGKVLSAQQFAAGSSSLLTGEPYRLFAPSVMERFYGAAAAPSAGGRLVGDSALVGASPLVGGGMLAA
jgi:hypothetical protein